MGCLGKGCLLIIVFLVLLVVAFVIGFYVGTKPKEFPQVQTSEDEQNAVRTRWDEFEAASKQQEPPPIVPAVAPSPETTSAPDATPTPAPTPSSPNRIELTASDINQLIARSRRTRGKAFVSIENDVARVQVTVPLEKVGFRGRSLNGEFSVRAPADHNPRNLQISQMSFTGVPDGVLSTLLGSHSMQSYVDEFAAEHAITSFTIENNKVILETSGGR
jgi:cytoskeletal protein RodZ